MEHRRLGRSGLMVPALTLGTGTFGGADDFFKGFGSVDVAQARLDAASARPLPYPYWHQRQFRDRNPPPVD